MHADTRRIDEALLLKPGDACELVGKFQLAEVPVDWRLERVAAPGRAAIVQRQDKVAVLRQQLVEQETAAAPGVHHELRMRPAVERENRRIFFLWIETGRLDEPRLQQRAVLRRNRMPFHRPEVHRFERGGRPAGQPSRFHYVVHRIRALEVLHGRRMRVRVRVHIEACARREGDAVHAGIEREPRHLAAVHRDAIEMPFTHAHFRRREIHKAVLRIHAVHARDFPFAVRELLEQSAGSVVQIQVAIAARIRKRAAPDSRDFAGPQNPLAAGENIQIVAQVDPVRVFFREHDA